MNYSRLSGLAGYYARARFLDDKRPILAGFKLTHRCTLKCRQCPLAYQLHPEAIRAGKRILGVF